MRSSQIIEQAENMLLHTYNRFSVVIDHGEGVYLYDTEGKKYLDFYSGIGVNALGHCYPELDKAMQDQIGKLLHISNYFYNTPCLEAGRKLINLTAMDRVFFTNSGTEAVESAIKLARRYGYKENKNEIIAMQHSFHGRTMGSLSITGTVSYQEPFRPLIGGVHFANINDLNSVLACITPNTCAIFLEPIQGEGGVIPATKEFVGGLRELCDKNDILLIFDEIQCGLGRTGTMFYYEQLGVRPDAVVVAKALGNGLPIGALLCTEKAASLVPGDHGSTYGGNPFVCSAASKVLDIFQSKNIIRNAQEIGTYLEQQLNLVVRTCKIAKERRGVGLMQGLELETNVIPIINEAIKRGLLLISAGKKVIRFLPPLIITKDHVDNMIDILNHCLKEQ